MAGDPLRKVRVGEPLKIPAAAWNAFVDAARSVSNQRHSAQSGPATVARDQITCLVKNNTGADVGQLGILSLGDPLVSPTDDEESFRRLLAFNGSTPSGATGPGKWCVTMEPVADGEIGRAVLLGVVPVEVDVSGGVEDFAEFKSGSTSVLEASATGTARILWIESTGDTRWAVVRLGDGAGSGSLTVKEIDGSPSYSSITTVEVDPADGFSISQPGAGRVRIDIVAATDTYSGVMSAVEQSLGGTKHWYSPIFNVIDPVSTAEVLRIETAAADRLIEVDVGTEIRWSLNTGDYSRDSIVGEDESITVQHVVDYSYPAVDFRRLSWLTLGDEVVGARIGYAEIGIEASATVKARLDYTGLTISQDGDYPYNVAYHIYNDGVLYNGASGSGAGGTWEGGICTVIPTAGGGTGTVTSIGYVAPAAGITITGTTPTTTTGTWTFALANDLAAIEALSGTNTIYYRSGADTWTAVTIGTGLTFSGGSLACTVSALADGDKGDITVSGSGATWTIDAGAVTDAKISDRTALSVFGRSANSSGAGADMAAASDGHVLRRSGTTLGFGTVATAGIADANVTDAKISNRTALSVFGRSANSAGVGADIAAGSDGQVLRRSGTAIGFGTVATAGIADAAVTLAKMADMATASLIGRNTAATGVPEVLSAATARSLLTLDFHGAGLYESGGDQSMTNVVYTNILFDTENFDSATLHSTSVNTDRITVGRTGKYLVVGYFWAHYYTGAGRTGSIVDSASNIAIDVNGTQKAVIGVSAGDIKPVVALLSLTSGDYVTLSVFHAYGATLYSFSQVGGNSSAWQNLSLVYLGN